MKLYAHPDDYKTKKAELVKRLPDCIVLVLSDIETGLDRRAVCGFGGASMFGRWGSRLNNASPYLKITETRLVEQILRSQCYQRSVKPGKVACPKNAGEAATGRVAVFAKVSMASLLVPTSYYIYIYYITYYTICIIYNSIYVYIYTHIF